MPHPDLSQAMHGVIVTTVTPFAPDGSLDPGSIEPQIRHVISGGVRVLVPCGNTGEFSSLGHDEIKTVISATKSAAPDHAIVIAGVGGASVTAIDQARHAQEEGVDAVMVHHPSHTYIDRDALIGYYQRIIDAVDIGVVLYKRGPEQTDNVITELVAHEQVIAVKYAVNDLNAFAMLVDRAGADACAWVCGSAERWAPFFHLAGAVGFTSGLANFAPQQAVTLFDALSRGDMTVAMDVRRRLTGFEELRQARHNANNVPAVKEAMRQKNLDSGVVREPLQHLSPADRSLVAAILQEWSVPRPDAVAT